MPLLNYFAIGKPSRHRGKCNATDQPWQAVAIEKFERVGYFKRPVRLGSADPSGDLGYKVGYRTTKLTCDRIPDKRIVIASSLKKSNAHALMCECSSPRP